MFLLHVKHWNVQNLYTGEISGSNILIYRASETPAVPAPLWYHCHKTNFSVTVKCWISSTW